MVFFNKIMTLIPIMLFIEIAIVAFAIIGAWRRKSKSILILAIAAVLSAASYAFSVIWEFYSRHHEHGTMIQILTQYIPIVAIPLTLVGWIAVSFGKQKPISN